MNAIISPVLVDEHAAAAALGMSVFWIRKDRTSGKPIVPFIKLGTRVLYDLQRCRLALASREQGGQATTPAVRS